MVYALSVCIFTADVATCLEHGHTFLECGHMIQVGEYKPHALGFRPHCFSLWPHDWSIGHISGAWWHVWNV